MRAVVALLFLAACASTPVRDYTTPIAESRAKVEMLMTRTHLPASAVAVTVGDRIVWHDAFGSAKIDTRFRVGSLTKLLTVAALMRLADQKRVALDDPVSKYLPDFPHGAITLRQLAGHLSGIRHYMNAEFFNSTHYTSATDSLRKFANDPLLSTPGEKYFYSSYAYNVLGAVIEKVTGQHFTKAVEVLVLRPAKMNETGFADHANSAAPFDVSRELRSPSPPIDLTDRLPAGAAVMTARDLARFLIAMSNPRFISGASRNTMFTSQATSDGKPTNVGIAWRIAKDEKGRTYVHHGGAVTGGRATVVLYPEERVAVAIVSNLGLAQFNEKDALDIAERFLP